MSTIYLSKEVLKSMDLTYEMILKLGDYKYWLRGIKSINATDEEIKNFQKLQILNSNARIFYIEGILNVIKTFSSLSHYYTKENFLESVRKNRHIYLSSYVGGNKDMTENEIEKLVIEDIELSHEYIVCLSSSSDIWNNITDEKRKELMERKEFLFERIIEIKTILKNEGIIKEKN